MANANMFKNQIIFKSALEGIRPIFPIWKNKSFNLKYLFEEEVELHLYYVINKFLKDNSLEDYSNNLYNIITLELEKSHEGDELKAVLNYLEKIKDIRVTAEELEYIRAEIKLYVKEVAFFYTIKESIDITEQIKNKTYGEASKHFYEIFTKFENAVKINLDGHEDKGINVLRLSSDDVEDSLTEGRKIRFPKEFNLLNDKTENGATTKSLNLMLGQTDIGKSRLLLNLAVGYFTMGYNVTYLTGELGHEEILLRVLSIVLKTPTKELRKKGSKAITALFKKYIQDNNITSSLYIKEFTSGSYTPFDFKSYVNSMKELPEEDRPSIYIVDGINNMSTEDEGKNSTLYTTTKKVAYKLLGIAKDEDIMIWAASQLNRDSYGKTGNDLSKIGEGFAMAQASTFCLIAEHNEELVSKGVQILKIDKNKYAKKDTSPIFIKLADSNLFNMEEIPYKSKDWNTLSEQYTAGGSKKGIDW